MTGRSATAPSWRTFESGRTSPGTSRPRGGSAPARPDLRRLRLRRWAHTLGFSGHWSTKSRRYSTTFKALRRARREYAVRRRHGGTVPLDAWARPESDEAVEVIASRVFAGIGHRTEGEHWLALASAARAREHRRIARQERSAA